ncbi:hypothetical protein PVAG01_07331 [Phlyctema vagabunda]|uniref:Uncharacterized protein n=1 Tax=Phlyctema vagabunda TaxID=108571 RepID=A0ABR4PC33_9HELO
MVGRGFVFAISDNFWILRITAIFEVIDPSGSET